AIDTRADLTADVIDDLLRRPVVPISTGAASMTCIRRASAAGLLLTLALAPRLAAQPVGDTQHDHAPTARTVIVLPRDLEIRLALNALPKELREAASVLVLEPSGYTKARTGTNPFTCMVSRRGGNFYPVCFDEEGTRTILPAFADDAVWRLKGTADEQIERQLADGFEQGRYRPPSRPGIAYM